MISIKSHSRPLKRSRALNVGHCMHRQRGLGLLPIMVIVSVSVFLGLFAFKVGPAYLENFTVNEIASDLAANTDMLRQPRRKVYEHLGKAYRTNNLWDLKPEETIALKKDGRLGYVVTVQYEKRANLFANIDIVTSFNKQASPGS